MIDPRLQMIEEVRRENQRMDGHTLRSGSTYSSTPISRDEGRNSLAPEDILADASHLMAPMREMLDGQGQVAYVHVPFTTSDLYNWKNQTPGLREDQDKHCQLWETIFASHQPTWADIQTLMNTLLSSEEKSLVLSQATALALEEQRQGGNAPGLAPVHVLPTQEPRRWIQTPGIGAPEITRYKRLILHGLKHAIPKPMNVAKIYEIHQEKEETPSSFLNRLTTAMRRFTTLNPEADENQRLLISLFIGQSSSDIRKKLQKVEGVMGMRLGQIMDIAFKVYVNRDELSKKEEGKLMKKQCSMLEKQCDLIAAVVSVNQTDKARGPRRRLQKDQCAKCLKKGHWAKDCRNKEVSRPRQDGQGGLLDPNPPYERMMAAKGEQEESE
ncbi:uncharacterized protein LOC133364805 [Rhineura floridana]|uniref:uncharacterized protein LOC133364805 n=1 Tax=Rhineura floridana TaxID=261503 RepID=UPI002AC86F23|nr:uncharacterized protein LOC133364805 [Rhineura floridana]XP_061441647.1 uncharacterized protein LOC133364805 [Rhineura floridana]XP_061441648.1 uncharacterized protein LOC133364805 [Rhineura floridana]